MVFVGTEPPRRLFDRRTASSYLGISLRKLDDLISRGVLKAVRLPHCDKTLLDAQDLRQLVASSKVQPGDIRMGTRTS